MGNFSTSSGPVAICVTYPFISASLCLNGSIYLLILETYIQVCISIVTFLTKKFELLIIFQNRTHQTIITSTVFCHFFINIVRRLYVAPAIIHTPSFIFQNHSGEFNTAACRATIGRNRPNIFLIPKIRKLRREHFGKSISQTTSIISFQRELTIAITLFH